MQATARMSVGERNAMTPRAVKKPVKSPVKSWVPTTRKQCLVVLELAKGTFRSAEIALAAGVTRRTVQTVLTSLCRSGHLERNIWNTMGGPIVRYVHRDRKRFHREVVGAARRWMSQRTHRNLSVAT